MWRPAWRIIHTGARSTFSPRAMRNSSGSFSATAASAAAASAGSATEHRLMAARGPNVRENALHAPDSTATVAHTRIFHFSLSEDKRESFCLKFTQD